MEYSQINTIIKHGPDVCPLRTLTMLCNQVGKIRQQKSQIDMEDRA